MQWMQLCEEAAVEQHAEKALSRVNEINPRFDEKEQPATCGSSSEAANKSPSALLFQFGYFLAEDSSFGNNVEVIGTK
jgi:hypothetical protein